MARNASSLEKQPVDANGNSSIKFSEEKSKAGGLQISGGFDQVLMGDSSYNDNSSSVNDNSSFAHNGVISPNADLSRINDFYSATLNSKSSGNDEINGNDTPSNNDFLPINRESYSGNSDVNDIKEESVNTSASMSQSFNDATWETNQSDVVTQQMRESAVGSDDLINHQGEGIAMQFTDDQQTASDQLDDAPSKDVEDSTGKSYGRLLAVISD